MTEHKNVRVAKQVCTTKLVSRPVKFTIANARASGSLSHLRVVYATGYARRTRSGWQAWLVAARDASPRPVHAYPHE